MEDWMADINVVRKSASIWPWILGSIVAALLIWALISLFGSDDEDILLVDPAAEVAPDPGAARPLDTPNP
jgi:hypothetical protein